MTAASAVDHAAVLAGVNLASPLEAGRHLLVESGVLYLADRSPLHATYWPGQLHRRVAPSLPLGQYLYETDADGLPRAFVNWAWLSPALLSEIERTGRDLEPDEFRCGERPFFYEFLAPFGHCRSLVRRLRDMPDFAGRKIPAIRGRAPDGSPLVKRFAF